MSQRLAELCSIFVGNAYGDLAAKIFSTLAGFGRLHLISLRQHSGLPLRRLKVGLTTLIQHHIVLHHANDDDEPTFFQVDWNAAYSLVRSRKFLNLIEDRHGTSAGQIVENILQLGHASIGDITAEYDLVSSAAKLNGNVDTAAEHLYGNGVVNGVAKHGARQQEQKMTLAKMHTTLRRLLADGVLVKASDRTYMPQADLQEHIHETVKANSFPDGKITGSKKSREFRQEVNSLKRKYQEDDSYSSTRDVVSHGQIKRANPDAFSNKRIKSSELPNGLGHARRDEQSCGLEAEHLVDKLPDEMVVHVNFDKCTTLLRNERLVRMVDQLLGSVTATVYAALLRALEGHAQSSQRRPFKTASDDDDDGDGGDDDDYVDPLVYVTDAEIYNHLEDSVDVPAGIKRVAPASKLANGTGQHRNKSHHVGDEDDDHAQLGIKKEHQSDSDSEDVGDEATRQMKKRRKRFASIDTHLHILAEHPRRFCTPSGRKWAVDFPSLAQTLTLNELDSLILARFGKIHLRSIRIIRHHGKLDDKPLAIMCLQDVKVLRAKLTELQFAGLLEIQELPKDNSRQPRSTVYLWWFDEDRTRSRFLEKVYVAMTRCLQRLKFEREGRFRPVIEKAERVGALGDVGEGDDGEEQEMLNVGDKEALRQWREVEEMLLVQIERLDELVGVFRDFSGVDISLMT